MSKDKLAHKGLVAKNHSVEPLELLLINTVEPLIQLLCNTAQ